jgi:chemotaxis family two-component system response regulator Rcp1
VNPIEILLVEDNPGDIRLTQESLKNSTFPNNLNVVRDGPSALGYLRSDGRFPSARRPDLILLDINLPGMNGCEVLDVIKKDPALRSIPVVVLSGSRAEQDISLSYYLHANCYVVKPMDAEEFIKVMEMIQGFWGGVAQLPSGEVG